MTVWIQASHQGGRHGKWIKGFTTGSWSSSLFKGWRGALVFQPGFSILSGDSGALAHPDKHSSWNTVSFSEFWTLNPSGRHKQTVVALMIDSSNLTMLPQEPSELLKSDFSRTDHHFDWGKCPKRFAFQGKISMSLLSWQKFISNLTPVTVFEDLCKARLSLPGTVYDA